MFQSIIKRMCVVGLLLTLFAPLSAYSQSLQSVIDKYCRTTCVSEQKLLDVAARAAKRFKIDKHAVLAIIHVESKYNYKAKNGSSVGLSQVHLGYHKPKFLGKNYFEVEDNVFAGMTVFRDCLTLTRGNYPKAYRCYNGGGDKNYVSKIMAAYNMLKSLDIPRKSDDPLGDFIVARVE